MIYEFKSLVVTRFQMGWLLAVFMAPFIVWKQMRWLMISYMIMAIAMGVFYMVMVRVSTDAGWWYMMLSVTVPVATMHVRISCAWSLNSASSLKWCIINRAKQR